MAFTSDVVWEVRTTGANTNGGGFASVSGIPGTDYSQQTSPQISYTDMVIGATTTQFTSVANAPTSAIVGNIINVVSGTGFTVQRVQVLSVAAGVATCDKSLGTTASTGGHGNLGGAAAISVPFGLAVAGNTIWIKATATYSITSQIGTSNLGSSGLPITVIGYNATRGDNGQVTVLATASMAYCIVVSQYNWRMYNVVANANNQATTGCFSASNSFITFQNCVGQNFTEQAFSISGTYCNVISCWGTGGTSAATAAFSTSSSCAFDSCVATANACTGFLDSSVSIGTYNFCISANNTGSSSDGFQSTQTGNSASQFNHCLSYGNGRDGLRFTGATGPSSAIVRNCIFVENAGFGVNSTSTNWIVGPTATQSYLLTMSYNFYFGNTSGAYNNLPAGPNDITGTGDPTVAGASGNFMLNNTQGAGAACRAAGFPGALQSGGTGYLDIGALQHQDSPAVIAPVYNMVETRYQ
jgi:hypothetical protein